VVKNGIVDLYTKKSILTFLKNFIKYWIVLSLLLNFYWLIIWTFAFYEYEEQNERQKVFKHFTGNLSNEFLSALLILITIISIIGLHFYYINGDDIRKNKKYRTIMAASGSMILYAFLFDLDESLAF
jgi:uncharacterized membrane protein